MSRSRSHSVTPPRSRHSKKSDTIRGFHLLELSRVQDMRRSDIGDYISRLHKLLKRTNKKAIKYKERCSKLKKQISKDEIYSNSSSSDDEPPNAVVTKSPKIKQDDSIEPGAADNTDAADSVSDKKCDEDPQSFVNEMKRAADQMAGFMYEPTSGLYYDCKTGYYFNAEHNLYYDGNTGCYYDLNKTTNQFVFHSQAYADEPFAEQDSVISNKKTTTTTSNSSKRKHTSQSASSSSRRKPASPSERKRDERHSRQCSRRRRRHSDSSSATSDDNRSVDEDREDGEISSDGNPDVEAASAGDAGEPMDDGVVSASPVAALPKAIVEPITYEDIARKYPPSLRLIVLETVQPKLRVGQLFMITYKGGSLGREGAHDVIIPDINVSKFHLSFKYNHDDSRYECIDLGSRNGTIFNGRRMSNAKQESEALPVIHGTVIGLSQTRLLCHIHEGHSTCDDCEPHKLLTAAATVSGTAALTNAPGVAVDGATLTHKQELKQLKKRYGLADEKYLIQQCTMPNDRAAQRRTLVGSTGGNEKTQTASVETNIPSNNKGFKMLAKLGWSQGQTLGKNESGLLQPIPLVSNTGKKGLGCEEFVPLVSSMVAKRAELMRKTQERFKLKVATAPEIFGVDGQLDV